MKRLLYSIVFIFGFLFVIKPTLAAVRCETQYGGNQVCVTTGQLQVNKEVYDPQNKKYVDNLGINDYKFAPGELISFRISTKNVGDDTLGNVVVSDTPQTGFLVVATGTLNFNFLDLKPGETRQQELKLRVVDETKLPQKNIICIVNAADATSDNNHDKDTSQICLERKTLGVTEVTELPKTGPEGLLLGLFGSASGVAVGARLLKFARPKKDNLYDGDSEYNEVENRKFRKEGGC